MSRSLNEVEWKEFLLDKLFKVEGSKTTKKEKLEQIGNGIYPYVTTQTTNNGHAGYYKQYTENGNVIVIDSAVVGFATYQENNFSASDHVEKLIPKFNMSKNIALFITTQLNLNNKVKFSYGYKACQDRLRKCSIILPVNTKGEPDYEFMEEYIKEKEEKSKQEYKTYIQERVAKLQKKVDIENKEWNDFYVDEIFSIKSGVRLTKANMKNGNIPFIGATDSNNGITNWVNNTNNSTDNNILGVNYNGSVVETFYHPYKCTFSDDVKRFKTKDIESNKYINLFLKNSILKQKCKYMYGYKFNEKRMKKQKILLPINTKGEPDYEFMHNYMFYLEQKKILEYLDYIQ